MHLQPLFDRIILKPKEKENKKGSIYLNPEAEANDNLATVLAVGPGGFIDGANVQMVIKTGDTVLFNKYAAIEFKAGDENLLIIKQCDIAAIVKGDS